MIKSRRMRWAGHVARMGEKRNAYRILVDNNKMDLREIGLDGIDWIHLAQDRDQGSSLVNMVMNIRVP
jgi:hypothetical protein